MKIHFCEVSPGRKEQCIELNVSHAYISLWVLPPLKTPGPWVTLVGANGGLKHTFFWPFSGPYWEWRVELLDLICWLWLDPIPIYNRWKFQLGPTYRSWETKATKVRISMVTIDRAPRKIVIKHRKLNIFSSGWRRSIGKWMLYTIHRNWAESEDLDWAA
jgi:hypothetical protein